MDHRNQQRQHQKERAHLTRWRKLREQAPGNRPGVIYATWFAVMGIVLVLSAGLLWTLLF